MITEDHVSFETAKLLKEKGFDDDWYPRITLQMAMKWLREVYHIFIRVIQSHIEYCACQIYYDRVNYYEFRESFNSYEEACEAAIKYCLKNLI